ncbi:hypothetical protein Tco_0262096 [Tanacetum coccineum]
MKDLVANKPRTEEDEEIRMNPRCSGLLQNQLPPKEQDLRSFILPCSIRRLDFNNALADLGANISIIPLSMYKLLGMGKLKPINMVIEMADNTKCTPKGIVENLLVKIDKFIFPVDFVILNMVEDFRMLIILGRPLVATTHAKESYEEIVYRITEVVKEIRLTPKEKKVHWCEAILQEKENVRQYWASYDRYNDVCDGGDYRQQLGFVGNVHKTFHELAMGKDCLVLMAEVVGSWKEDFRKMLEVEVAMVEEEVP